MSNNQEPSRKPTEKHGNSSFLWFALIIISTVMLVGWLLFSQSEQRIAISDFEELLRNTKFLDKGSDQLAPNSTASITIRNHAASNKTAEFSEPNDIVVADQTISGNVYFRWVTNDDTETKREKTRFTVNKNNTDTVNAQLREILNRSNVRWSYSRGPSFFDRYGSLLVFSALVLVLFLFMMRRLAGSAGPMQFGRSRGRLYAEEDLAITFGDVAGIDEAVEEVREIVDFLKQPEKYQRLGGRIPRGVLLVGPPGTGKTLLAKAIAGEAGVPFFSLSGSDFVEMFVGVGAARVRDMFQQAVAKAPCIIFIDELDALGKTRGAGLIGGHDEREQTLNALLVEMDGFDSNSGVIVIAATNRPETLDAALLRPGRFDRHVLVDRPDVRGREEILKVHVRNVKLDESVELRKIAAISPGFAGADLANLVNEAALLAARNDKAAVGMVEFNEGVERVTAGLEKKKRVMSADEKQRVAYHESGHALVAYSLPNTDPVHKVSIIPRGLAALGYTMQRPEDDRYLMTQSELESQLQVLLAGTIAEEMVYQDISTGAQNDLERATDIARAMVMQFGMSRLGRINYRESRTNPFLSSAPADDFSRSYSERTAQQIDDEVKRIIDESVERVRHILEVRRSALESLTNRLIEIESVDGDELKRIVEDNSTVPIVVPGTANAATKRPSSTPAAKPADDEFNRAAP